MDDLLHDWVANWHWSIVVVVMAASTAALVRGADWLVEEALAISVRLRLSRAVVGATVISLGTTTPEAAVSVLAAIGGNPGLALGNAVGSIICDTGLILGLACLIRPVPIDRHLTQRQGRMQLAAAILLILVCIPWRNLSHVFVEGGRLPQAAGWVFLALLAIYLIWSVRMAGSSPLASEDEAAPAPSRHLIRVCVNLVASIAIVLVSSSFLIATATELAARLKVPPSIVAATLVAFGTSLPELMIAITAALKGHGELAMGNIIGADILNVLFVSGSAAAVTPGGLHAEPHFFRLQFPAMLFVLIAFRAGISRRGETHLSRFFGLLLLAAYLLVTALSYWLR